MKPQKPSSKRRFSSGRWFFAVLHGKLGEKAMASSPVLLLFPIFALENEIFRRKNRPVYTAGYDRKFEMTLVLSIFPRFFDTLSCAFMRGFSFFARHFMAKARLSKKQSDRSSRRLTEGVEQGHNHAPLAKRAFSAVRRLFVAKPRCVGTPELRSSGFPRWLSNWAIEAHILSPSGCEGNCQRRFESSRGCFHSFLR